MMRPRPAFFASLKTRRVLTSMPDRALIDDHRGIDAAHGADRLADEVGIARRVDHVEPLAGVVEMHDAGFDRVFVGLFFFVEIADARAVIDVRQPVDRAGLRQHPIDQHGLAGRAVSADNDVANVLDLILGHEWSPR